MTTTKDTCVFQPEVRECIRKHWHRNQREHHIEYNGFLSNHLDHAVVALAGIGATAAQVDTYVEAYIREKGTSSTGLEPPKPLSGLTVSWDTMEAVLGRDEVYPDALAFFQQQLRDLGPAEVAFRMLPRLYRATVSAALHPAIHTGYTVELGLRDPDIWAEGLAYATSKWVDQGVAVEDHNTLPDWLTSDDLQALLLKTHDSDDLTRMAVATHTIGFQTSVRMVVEDEAAMAMIDALDWKCPPLHQWPKHEDGLVHIGVPFRGIQAALWSVFGSIRGATSFFLLHGITCLQATKATLTFVASAIRDSGQQEERGRTFNALVCTAVRSVWRAVLLAYVVIGMPRPEAPLPSIASGASAAWDDVLALVLNHKGSFLDEHVIKLAFVGHSLWLERGSPDTCALQPVVAACYHNVVQHGWNFSVKPGEKDDDEEGSDTSS